MGHELTVNQTMSTVEQSESTGLQWSWMHCAPPGENSHELSGILCATNEERYKKNVSSSVVAIGAVRVMLHVHSPAITKGLHCSNAQTMNVSDDNGHRLDR